MKKLVSALLGACLSFVLCACASRSTEPPAAASLTDPPVSDGGTQEPPEAADHAYMARGVSADSGSSFGRFGWQRDGTLWVQDLNTIHIIGLDNSLVKTVTLDDTKLPPYYNLTWSGGMILAARAASRGHEFGAVYQAGGKISLCNVSVWDMDGNLIKEYPAFPLGADEADWTPAAPDGTKLDWWHGIYEGMEIYWLDSHTLAINGHSRVIIYDLDSDTGRVVDDMSGLVDKYGKFGVYYGVDYNFCYVHDGTLYYLSHRNEEKSNTAGTVWKVGKDEARASVMFEGKEFTHLYMDDGVMALTQAVEDPYGYNLWWADTQSGTLREMGNYEVHIPVILDQGRVSMSGDARLYCYDTRSPEESALTVVDTGDGGVYGLFGTRLADGGLQFVCSGFNPDEDPLVSFYLQDAKTGGKTLIGQDGLYSGLLMNPERSHCVIYGAGERDGQPRVRVVKLD